MTNYYAKRSKCTRRNRRNKLAQRAISRIHEFFKNGQHIVPGWRICAPECSSNQSDNIIKVTILMDALLKRVNYSRAIIAGNALHWSERFGISPDTLRISDRRSLGNVKVSQRILRMQFRSNFRNYVAALHFSPGYVNINPSNHSRCNDDNKF